MNNETDELANLKSMRDVFDYCQRKKLHSVAQGMIELPPPLRLRQIVAEALLDENLQHIHQYRSRFGEPDYLESIRKLLKKHYNVEAPQGSILAASGVTAGIVATLLTLRSQGRKNIALIEPFYTYHGRQVEEVFGFGPSAIPGNPDFSPNWDEIEKALKGGVDCIILCNPANPTGRVWSAEELRKLVELCKPTNTWLLLDEIYCDMVFEGHKHYSPIDDGLLENVVVCRGFSKTLGAQSWRLAYVVSHPNTITALMAHHDPVYISVTWQQHCLARYLDEEYEDFVAHIKTINKLLQDNWNILHPAFTAALGWQPVHPSGSMYGMFKHGLPSDIAAMQAGLKMGVGVAAGSMFFIGAPENTGYIRIHVGVSAEKAKQIADTLYKEKQKQTA